MVFRYDHPTANGSLQWRHNECDGVPINWRLDCSLNRSFRWRLKNQSSTSVALLRGIHRWLVDSPSQRASNAGNLTIWWRHDVILAFHYIIISRPGYLMTHRTLLCDHLGIPTPSLRSRCVKEKWAKKKKESVQALTYKLEITVMPQSGVNKT